jgi:hypothetical protein
MRNLITVLWIAAFAAISALILWAFTGSVFAAAFLATWVTIQLGHTHWYSVSDEQFINELADKISREYKP